MNTLRGLGDLTTALRGVERRKYRSTQGAMLAMAMLEIENMRLSAESRRIDARRESISQRQAWIAERQHELWQVASHASPGLGGQAAGDASRQAKEARPSATPAPPAGVRSRRLTY